MQWVRIATAVSMTAMAGAGSSLAFGQNPECRQSCNGAYQQCLSSGKAGQACLGTWHQCKSGCVTVRAGNTPARMAVHDKPVAQAKPPVGKH